MNETEQKILKASLKLYNSKGIDSITVRHVAAKMDIRHSNITYYFPKKNDIVKGLYSSMQSELTKVLTNFKPSKDKDKVDFSLFGKLFDVLYKYRFTLINTCEILKRSPELKAVYSENNVRRGAAFVFLIDALRKKEVLRDDLYDGWFEVLMTNVKLISNYYIVFSELNPGKTKKEQKNFYLKLMMSAFIPYLNEKGKIGFEEQIKSL